MRNIIILLAITLFSTTSFVNAEERSPFTKISFGLVFGWGDFIKVDNELLDSDKTHYLIEVNGMDYKDIITEAKKHFNDDYKCMLAEHFVETMEKIGIDVGESIDLKIYPFYGNHTPFVLEDVSVTEDNLWDLVDGDNYEEFCN